MAKTPHDDVFRLAPKRQQSKADITDSTVRAILTEESAERSARTLKLREARLAMEASKTVKKPAAKPAARRATRKAKS